MSDDDKPQDEAPEEKVKKAMGRRKRVSAEAPPQDEQPPEPPPHDAAPEEGEPDYGPAGSDADDGIDDDDITVEQWQLIRQCAELDQNDRDNGRRLVLWYGADMAYTPGLGWLVFTGTHWKRDEGELSVRLKAQDLVDWIKLEAVCIVATPKQERLLAAAEAVLKKPESEWTEADKKLMKRAESTIDAIGKKKTARRNFAVSSGNTGKTAGMLAQAASHRATDQAVLDHDRKFFNVLNGTLEFGRIEDPEQDLTPEPDGSPIPRRHVGAVEFRPHRREDMITKLAEVEYDPEATCPLWLAFLEKVQPDPVMRLFLQVFHAYAMLIGGNDAQKVIFHFGFGANGKSVFIETLGNLAGTFRTVVSPDTVSGDTQRAGQQASPDIARLYNTRFVVIEELPRGTPLRENLVKAVSGGSTMTARFLQKEIFEFKPIFTPILSGNDLPEIKGLDNGIWRRVLITPWRVTIPDAEQMAFNAMLDMFAAERPGILNWLIDGLMLYLRDGLDRYIPAEVREFTHEYREELDPVGRFVAACVIHEPDQKVQAKDLFDAYERWSEANGIRAWKQTAFGLRLNALGFKKTPPTSRLVYYLDIRLGDVPSRFDPRTPAPPADPSDPGWKPSQM